MSIAFFERSNSNNVAKRRCSVQEERNQSLLVSATQVRALQTTPSSSRHHERGNEWFGEIQLRRQPRRPPSPPHLPHERSYPTEQEKRVDTWVPQAARSRRGRVADLYLCGGTGGEYLIRRVRYLVRQCAGRQHLYYS